MAKIGRKLKELDRFVFEALCSVQCTEVEICDYFGITDKTLSAWCQREYGLNFSEISIKKRNAGKISLRRMGWRHAEKNFAAWIFHAKNYLGMRDNPDGNDDSVKKITEFIDSLKKNADCKTD
jgi:hypothetical protein